MTTTPETASFPDVVPVLTDGVVTLRAHRDSDAPAIFEQCTDPDMQRWTTVPAGYRMEHAEQYTARAASRWEDPTGERQWALEWVDDDGVARFGGTVDLRAGESPETASIGFGLHPAARGRGLMARAVRLVARYAFTEGPWGRPLQRIHWRAVVGNWGSRRVAWATGFVHHGTLPGTHGNTVDPDGPALDSWYASLTAVTPMEPATPWHEAPVVEAGDIRLRPWREADVEAVEPRDDPAHWVPVASVLRRETFPDWLHRRRELMAEGASVEWCVADAATDRALGSVLVFTRGTPMVGDWAELGYQLFPSARGRGVATAAAAAAIRYATTPRAEGGLGLRRLVAETAADNAASNRVLEANGFVAFGREHAVDRLPDGTYTDGLHWERVDHG